MNQLIINEILKILGNIPKPKFIKNNELAFLYSPLDGGIIYYKNLDKISFYYYLFHELRHHYQYYYIKNNHDKYAKIIKEELANYNMNNYYNLFIELDSFSFAYLMIKKLFKVEYHHKSIHFSTQRLNRFINDNKDYYKNILKGGTYE